MRKYQRIWEQLKINGRASLLADEDKHRRIIKAVTKEKSQDVLWQLVQAELGLKKKLINDVQGRLIQFELVEITCTSIRSL